MNVDAEEGIDVGEEMAAQLESQLAVQVVLDKHLGALMV